MTEWFLIDRRFLSQVWQALLHANLIKIMKISSNGCSGGTGRSKKELQTSCLVAASESYDTMFNTLSRFKRRIENLSVQYVEKSL